DRAAIGRPGGDARPGAVARLAGAAVPGARAAAGVADRLLRPAAGARAGAQLVGAVVVDGRAAGAVARPGRGGPGAAAAGGAARRALRVRARGSGPRVHPAGAVDAVGALPAPHGVHARVPAPQARLVA